MTEVQNANQFAPLKKMITANGDFLIGEQEGGDNSFASMVENFFGFVEKNGLPEGFTWTDVKSIIIAKFDEVTKKYETERSLATLPPVPNVDNYTFEEYRTRILEHLNNFDDAPFTLGRICELLRDPRKHYDRGDKFLRAFEKCVTVTSTNIGSDSTQNGSTNGHTNGNGNSHMEIDGQMVAETTTSTESNGHVDTNGTTSNGISDHTPNVETGETATTEADSTVSKDEVAETGAVMNADTTTDGVTETAGAVVDDTAAVSSTESENVDGVVTEEKETLKRPNEADEHDSVAKKVARIENGETNGCVVDSEMESVAEEPKKMCEEPTTEEGKTGDVANGVHVEQEAAM